MDSVDTMMTRERRTLGLSTEQRPEEWSDDIFTRTTTISLPVKPTCCCGLVGHVDSSRLLVHTLFSKISAAQI